MVNNALAMELSAVWRGWIDGEDSGPIANENRARFAEAVHKAMPTILAALRTPAPAPVAMCGDDGPHPSHKLRISDASTCDFLCENCNHADQVPGGWGKLAEPCAALQAQPAPAPEQDAVERVARAICKAGITHEVVGDVPQGQLDQMVENLTIKYFPEARAALAAMPPKAGDLAADEVRKLAEKLHRLHEHHSIGGTILTDAADMLERLTQPQSDSVAVELLKEVANSARVDSGDKPTLRSKRVNIPASLFYRILAAIRSGGAS